MAKRKKESQSVANLKKQRLHEDQILKDGFASSALDDWENEEQEYEYAPRKVSQKRVVEGLPTKTADGKIQRNVREENVEEEEEEEPEEEAADEKAGKEGDQDEEDEDEVYTQPEDLNEEEKIIRLQEDISEIAEKLMELPEENMASLTRLRKMAMSKNENTAKYSLLALVPIFKSIIPGYRIRPLTEIEKKAKVSKDVAKLRAFEQGLLANYKAYIVLLQKYSRNTDLLGHLSVTAACELMSSVAHFNFVDDLSSIVVWYCFKFRGKLPKDESEKVLLFHKCTECLRKCLSEDALYGKLSLVIVGKISQSLKKRNFQVNKDVVALYLSLAVLGDFEGHQEPEDKPKVAKKDRVYLTKKERKRRKELKEIEEEMREAEDQVSQEERHRNQNEVLKTVLTNYLQILKVRNDHLISTTLEGLSKYGFLANLEMIGDFLQVLKELITELSNSEDEMSDHRIKQIMFCIVTAFVLVNSSGSAKIKIDLSKFIEVLYSVLLEIPNDEDINKSIKLVIRTLENVFIVTRSSMKIRNLAFTKRIFMVLLSVGEKPALQLLAFLEKLMVKNPEIKGMFNVEDKVENGFYNMDADHYSRSNAEAAVIWESCLLSQHYCKGVSERVKKMAK